MASPQVSGYRTLICLCFILISGLFFVGRDETILAASTTQKYRDGSIDLVDAVYDLGTFFSRILIGGYGIFALLRDMHT